MAEGGPLSECRSEHGNQMIRYPTDPLPEGLNLDAAAVLAAHLATHSDGAPMNRAAPQITQPGTGGPGEDKSL